MNAATSLSKINYISVLETAPESSGVFRAIMRGIASTVMLITACDRPGKWYGMAATAFTPVSMDPATCHVCINHTASIYETLGETGAFCVNVMHQRNREAMRAYTMPEFRTERFKEDGWMAGRDGVPFYTRAQANIFCNFLSAQRVGSHDVIVAQVVSAISDMDVDPLVYCEGDYRRSVTTS